MNQDYINQKAKESFHQHFNEETHVHIKEDQLMTKEEIENIVSQKLADKKEKQEALDVLRQNINGNVKEKYNEFYGQKKPMQDAHHPTFNEMKAQLKENVTYQTEVAHSLKQDQINK